MASKTSVALILGSGPNVGHHVAKALLAKGYDIALVSRNVKTDEPASGIHHFAADLSKPEAVAQVFEKVKSSLGPPSVVIYNATKNDPSDALSLPLDAFEKDLMINTISAFAAAQESVKAFQQLPTSASRTFIYTGNILNTTTIGGLMTLGVGKSATAHVIQSAAEAYADQGFKFYYADERKVDGSAAYFHIDGEAHGKFYAELTEHKKQGPWYQTFVKGEGYKYFTKV